MAKLCDIFFVTLALTILLPAAVRSKQRSSEAFMSNTELKEIFRMEAAMVDVLRSHKSQLEASLDSIRGYVKDVEKLYAGEGCPMAEGEACKPDVMAGKIVGNPIYNYQLIKRLVVYWKNMEAQIKKVDAKQTLADLKRIKHKFGGLPTDNDLQGAARALLRLEATYGLDLAEFSRGNILGHQTEAVLSAKDTFYLGRYAYMSNSFEEALKWLEVTALQVAANQSGLAASNGTTSSTTTFASASGVKESQVEQMVKQVNRKIQTTSATKDTNADKASLASALASKEKRSDYRLGHVPPKTHDRSKMNTPDDRINYEALCRGEQLLPPEKEKELQCYYTTPPGDSYFLLRPLKVEVHHEYPHKIVSIHEVLSDEEADGLVAVAEPRMVKASIGHGKEISEMRVSRNCWVKDGESDLVDSLSPRLNWITGLQTSWKLDKFDEGREEEYEHLQIANYGVGGHYNVHQDPMFVYKEPDFMAYSVETIKGQTPYITGDRLATFMLYLSDVPLGGLTAFPRLGVAVKPVKGSAVFWFNIRRSGRSDMHMLHGGCPVILGSKWVANKWIREAAQTFTHPCIGHIDY